MDVYPFCTVCGGKLSNDDLSWNEKNEVYSSPVCQKCFGIATKKLASAFSLPQRKKSSKKQATV